MNTASAGMEMPMESKLPEQQVNLALLTIVVAAVYFVSGYIGFLLAIPPGNVTILWPPAGIAMAVVLIYGPRAALGIFVGAALVNGNAILGETLPPSLWPILIASFFIGIGSCLQPLAGRLLIGKFLDLENPFHNGKALVISLPLFAIACLISSSIGALSLGISGQAEEPLGLFYIWWLGDYIGVVAFMPMALAIIRKSRLMSGGLFLTALITFGGTFFLAENVRQNAEATWDNRASRESERLTTNMISWIETSLSPVNAMAASFEASDDVFEDEFFETAIRLEDFQPDFFPRSLSVVNAIPGDGKDAPPLWEVLYSTDDTGEFATGEQIETHDPGAKAIEAALSDPGRVVIGEFAEIDGAGFAIAGVAIEKTGLDQVVLGAIELNRLFEGLYAVQVPPGFHVRVLGSSSNDLHDDLEHVYSHTHVHERLIDTKIIRATAGHAQFSFEWSITEAFLPGSRTELPDAVLVGGIIGSSALILFISFVLGQNEQIRQRVRERTAELAESQSTLQLALENMSDGMFMIDKNMKVALMNNRYLNLMGLDENNVSLGSNIETVVQEHARRGDYGEGDPGELVRARMEVLGNAEASEREMRLADGSKVLQLRKAPIDGGGAVVVVSDVTDVTKAREELKRSEEEVRLILESIGEGVFGVDMEGRVSFANPRALELLDYASDELIGEKVHALIHHSRLDGSSYPVEECPMFRAYTAGISSQIDNEVLWRKDGTPFPVEYSATPIRRENNIIGAVIAFNDVTERRKAENRLKSVIDTASDGIIVIDGVGSLLTFSPAAEKIFGFEAAEVLGQNISMLMPEPDRAEHDAYIDRFHKTGERRIVGSNREVKGLRKDGSEFPMDLAIGEAIIGKDKIFTGIVRDITERKEAERKLSDAYEVISGSIQYASRIQQAVLTGKEMMKSVMSDYFVIWEPRDVVGGDIYWCSPWGHGVLVIAADCTGHGVPGAFMTLIAGGALDRALGEVEPGQLGALIQKMHLVTQFTLNQHGGAGGSDDGLELSACFFDIEDRSLVYSGARLPMFIVENGEVTVLKGTKSGIGYRGIPETQEFDEISLELRDGQSFYMVTDGLIDQIGGERRRMYGKKRLQALLLDIQELPFSEQKQRIMSALMEFQGDETRRDDVTVLGFKP